MKANMVYSDEDQERIDNIKKTYQKMLPSKVRKALRHGFFFNMFRCSMVAHEKTFFPDMERKKYITRLFDNYRWYFKRKKVNLFYNRFGMDIKGFRNMDDYMEWKEREREIYAPHHKRHPLVKYRKEPTPVRYSILADNKSIFYDFIEKMFPDNIPKHIFTFMGDQVISPYVEKKKTKDYFYTIPDGKYIIKPEMGSRGISIVAITKKGKKITISDENTTLDDIIEHSKISPFIVQEFLVQHEKISALQPRTVNTIRIISTRWNEETQFLAAMIRTGSNDSNVVDNASQGGTFIAVNLETGKLDKYGYYYDKPRSTTHPITGLKYEGYQIPYWKETIELIKKLHPIIFGFTTIGWDIAITERGPIIVEINYKYSLKGIQVCNGGLRKKWYELKEK